MADRVRSCARQEKVSRLDAKVKSFNNDIEKYHLDVLAYKQDAASAAASLETEKQRMTSLMQRMAALPLTIPAELRALTANVTKLGTTVASMNTTVDANVQMVKLKQAVAQAERDAASAKTAASLTNSSRDAARRASEAAQASKLVQMSEQLHRYAALHNRSLASLAEVNVSLRRHFRDQLNNLRTRVHNLTEQRGETRASSSGCVRAQCACRGGTSTQACPLNLSHPLRQCAPWGPSEPTSCSSSATSSQSVPVSFMQTPCCYNSSDMLARVEAVPLQSGTRVLAQIMARLRNGKAILRKPVFLDNTLRVELHPGGTVVVSWPRGMYENMKQTTSAWATIADDGSWASSNTSGARTSGAASNGGKRPQR